MPRMINSYAPMTPVGQSLQNISLAFFGDRSPRDQAREQSVADANNARMRLYEAQAEEERAKRDREVAALQGRQNFLGNTYESLVPAGDHQAARNFITGAPVLAFEDQRQPRPDSLTPALEAELRLAHSLAPLIQAGSPTSTVENLAKARGQLQSQGFADQTARGVMSPTRFFQLNEKAPFAVQGDTLVNIAEGLVGRPTDLGEAKIGTQWSQQRENDAQAGSARASAGASNALAAERGARTTQIRSGANLPLERVDVEGVPTLVPRADAINRPAASTPRAAPAPKQPKPPKPLNAGQLRAITEAIDAEEDEGGKFDQETRRRISSRASQLTQDGTGEYFGDPVGAVQAAMGEMGGFDRESTLGFSHGPRRAKAPTSAGASGSFGAPAPTGGLPQQARAKLREGVVTTFGNGQRWTLQNGQPVKVE